jgi:hypothetical protein
MVNLWAPEPGLALGAILLTAFLLGVVHGITPDEHTWPITFSYAIGSYSTRRGLMAGLLFSLAFTFQRAIASELAALALVRWLEIPVVNYIVYVVVGVAMFVAGYYMLSGRHWHLFHSHKAHPVDTDEVLRDPRPWMPAVHGFIAGWGVGAFAIILFTVLAPQMGILWGWVPGALFGLGTTAVQALAGALFGGLSRSLGLGPDAIRQVALRTASRTLFWGGVLFVAGGLFGLAFPNLAAISISTGIHIHNLDSIGLPILLVAATVLGVGVTTLVQGTLSFARQRTTGTSATSVGGNGQ